MGVAVNPKILVCGGREYTNRQAVYEVLDRVYQNLHVGMFGRLMIIEGGARGADRFAQDWAKEMVQRGYPVILNTVEADWDKYKLKAGSIRNGRMADMEPHLCIAFPGDSGTANMRSQCKERGIPVYEPFGYKAE